MKRNLNLRLLSYGVIAYMVLAFAWWSVLLYIKNRDAFQAKTELLRIGMVAEGRIANENEFLAQPAYQALSRRYKAQEWMIFGEAAVFMLSLAIGVWLINRGYIKDMHAARQQRNFLLSITHELKSPIASIRLVLETIRKRDLSKEQAERLTGNALTETERLNTLVNDLLLSAKLETAYQINRENVCLPDLLRELLAQMEHKYPEGSFSLDIHGDIPPISGDKMALTSVGLNLLENAVKYSPKPALIAMGLEKLPSRLRLTVADQGIGINEKEKKAIFEKFYRVGNEDTRQTKGTGLGLYIVDQIVKAHDGSIVVLDNTPKGTVFQVDLPLLTTAVATPSRQG